MGTGTCLWVSRPMSHCRFANTHKARLKHLSYLVLNRYGMQIYDVEKHSSYLFPNGYCMQICAVEKAKDLVKKPDDALDVKRRQIQCTLVHVDVVVFHLNRAPRVSAKGYPSWSDAGDEHEIVATAKALAGGSNVSISGGKEVFSG